VIRRATIGLLTIALFAVSAVAGQQTPSMPSQVSYRERVFGAFNNICLRNRGSWDGMKQAAETSPLGFRVTDGKGHYAIDYIAFPVSVGLRQRMPAYLCLVESVVEEPVSGQDFVMRLNAEGFGLKEVSFKADKKGVFTGKIPGTDRSTGIGILYTNVSVRLSKSPIQAMQIVQLALTN
jgi:hypothetical protein